MNKTKLSIKTLPVLFLLISTIISCEEGSISKKTAESERPKNIILMIGDGMGLSQISSSIYFGDKSPNFMKFKHIGLINTSSAVQKITDSAAGATAFATGELTYNGALGVNTDTISVLNITEYLSGFNYSNGLVATSSITHATPAGFYAHVKSRNMNEQIASQLVHSNIDFFIGGGRKYFEERDDHINLVDSLEYNGFKIYDSLEEFTSLQSDIKYGVLAAENALPEKTKGRGDFLLKGTSIALDYLSSRKSNFFLMIEESQIDWGGHQNDANYLIAEVLDFDKVIGEVLEFADKNGQTLVIVTADHETGGFTLGAKRIEGRGSDYDQIDPTFSTGGHSATLIPVFAYGPGAEEFNGIYKNREIFHKIINLLNL